MAKSMREAEGFNNMFASLGFGMDSKPKKESDHTKEETAAQTKIVEEGKATENHKQDKDTKDLPEPESNGKESIEKNESNLEEDQTNQDLKDQKSLPDGKENGKEREEREPIHQETRKTPEEISEYDDEISNQTSVSKISKQETSTITDSGSKSKQTKNISNKSAARRGKKKTGTSSSKGQQAVSMNEESSENENTSVRLYARNKRYFEIRAAQLGVSQMEYINFLLEEEEKREAKEELDPFSIELPKKESTSIKALVLTKHNMEFLRSASSNLGMKMTQFINWMLDNERKEEKENGPRQSIDTWRAIQNEEQ
ncbi:MAG: hypothetical protein PUE94_04545 [Lachnospiraceae bacterium]|nr:hypothetical protein [Lachnospiraceae bacterium]